MTLKNNEGQKEIQIGGQAVIEGVVMRGPSKWALSVRRPNGEIYTVVDPTKTIAQRHPKWNVFPFRGLLTLADSLVIGVKSLSLSANIALEEEEEGIEPGPEAEELSLNDHKGVPETRNDTPEAENSGKHDQDGIKEVITKWEMGISIAIALVVFVGVFIALPTVIARLLDPYINNTVIYNLIEGGIRVLIFIVYLLLITLMPDIRRVFEYHGAEHKVVNAYEHGLALYPGSVVSYPTAHPRCGTSFLLIVLVISVIIFSFFGRPALWLRILERIAVIPIVATISYEIIRLAGKYEDSKFLHILVAPGLWLQRITTKEPDKEQLEVAICSLKAALDE